MTKPPVLDIYKKDLQHSRNYYFIKSNEKYSLSNHTISITGKKSIVQLSKQH